MVLLSEGLTCKGKKKVPQAWDTTHGSLSLEQNADVNSGGTGRGAWDNRQEPDHGILEARLGCGLILQASGGTERFMQASDNGQVCALERSLAGLQWRIEQRQQAFGDRETGVEPALSSRPDLREAW